MTDLRTKFRNPDSGYRTAPLWVWNDLMDEKIIDFQLRELKKHGFGGAFVHPRPGLITEYLSEDWFNKWSHALQTAKKLDMKLYIYDENSYPSGFAGGHVPAQLPDCLATSITYRIEPVEQYRDNRDGAPKWVVNSNLLRVYAVTIREDDKEIIRINRNLTDVPQDEWHRYGKWIMTIELVPAQTMSWLAGFAYVDMMRPEVTQTFLKTTYDAYHERFGEDFGKHIPAIFTDEPAVAGSNIYQNKKTELPFSYWFAAEFEKRRGYHLLDHLPALFKNVDFEEFVKPPEKVRYDYYCTVRELWIENSIQPIAKWCEEHGIAWTGHFLENFWPLAGGMMVSPSIMAAYEYFQWPAIDLLLGSVLRDKPTDDLLVTLLEVKSVSNQFGKERVLCEAYGAGGWDSTLEDYKRMGDWLFVHGINFICQHYTLTTTAGARKRDHPQSFDWREPWWDDYTDLNHYNARLSYLLSQGKMNQRILVLHPTTTGYLVPKEKEDSDLMWGKPPQNPNMIRYLDLLQTLTANQWDFDLGDEFIMERHARVHDQKLVIGQQSYEVVIVSGDMKNMKASTLNLLTEFLDAGGTVIAHGTPGPYVEGEQNPQAYETLVKKPQFAVLADINAVLDKLRGKLGLRIKSSSRWPLGAAHMRRELDDNTTVYFFVNHSMDIFESFIELEGSHIEKWNPWNGEVETLPYRVTSFGIGFDLKLHRNESTLLVVKKQNQENHQPAGSPIIRKPKTEVELPIVQFDITPEEKNVLVIDYCDLAVDNKVYTEMNTIEAGHQLFRHRGFPQNPWDNAVQFKRRILDRNDFGKGSGFSVTYRFRVAADLPDEPLFVVAERAKYYHLTVNGQPVDWIPGESWLDHHNGVADIRPFVRVGDNTITLTAETFHVFLEIEPLYLRGNFSVRPVDGSWVLDQPAEVSLGSWIHQGYPFYPGAFRYRYQIEVPKGSSSVFIELPRKMETTGSTLYVNSQRLGLIGIDDGGKKEITSHLTSGMNEITLRVCGGLKNLLGPHHDPARQRRTAWPNMWRTAPKFGKPAAENYDIIAYGLEQHPKFSVVL